MFLHILLTQFYNIFIVIVNKQYHGKTTFSEMLFGNIGELLDCRELSDGYPQFSFWASVVNNHKDPKLLFDLAPQMSNSMIILGMAFERYILVCYAKEAKKFLNRSKRSALYIVTILSMCFACGFLFLDFFKPTLFSENLSQFSVKFAPAALIISQKCFLFYL